MLHWEPIPDDEIDVVVRRQRGRHACANIKESRAQALKELPDGFYVCGEAGPRPNACTGWVIAGWSLEWTALYSYKGALMPQEHECEEVCKRCSAALFTPTPQDSGSDTDPSTDID